MSPYSEAFFFYSFSVGNFPVVLLFCFAPGVLLRASGLSCLMRTAYSNNDFFVGMNAISL